MGRTVGIRARHRYGYHSARSCWSWWSASWTAIFGGDCPNRAVDCCSLGELHIRNVIVGWWDLLAYAAGVNGVLALILVGVGSAALRKLGSLPVIGTFALREHRFLGMAAWFVVLSGSYTLSAATNPAAVAATAVAGLAAMLLMPAAQATAVPRSFLGASHDSYRALRCDHERRAGRGKVTKLR